jgi:hypothetical protein
MDIQQNASLVQDPGFSTLVTQKDELLSREIDLAAASGTWDLTHDERDRALLVLRLQDRSGGLASAQFAPDEFHNDSHFSSRLHNLKGALYRIRDWRNELAKLYADIRQWCQQLPGGHTFKRSPSSFEKRAAGNTRHRDL